MKYLEDALGERRGVFYNVPSGSEEWAEIELQFSFLEEARRELLALGGAIEVIAPEALRRSMQDFAGQITRTYTESSD